MQKKLTITIDEEVYEGLRKHKRRGDGRYENGKYSEIINRNTAPTSGRSVEALSSLIWNDRCVEVNV